MQRDETPGRITGRELQRIRAEHFQREPLCVMCLAKTPPRTTIAMELDHIVPLFAGGADTADNRQGLCVECHALKTAKDRGYIYRPRIGLDGWPVDNASMLSQESAARRIPQDLYPSAPPLTIVCGPPGAGKSTYVRTHCGANHLVIDLDVILTELSGLPTYQSGKEWLTPALDQRNRLLRGLAKDDHHVAAWFIVGAPSLADRMQWHAMLGGDLVLLDTPLRECIRRINTDPARLGQRSRMIDAAAAWWRTNAATSRVPHDTTGPGGRGG